MDERQIIWPTHRLMANPKLFMAIANYFDGPDWQTFASAFYDLMENEILESEEEPEFFLEECCFREKPYEDNDTEGTYQVILSTGSAIELKPMEGSWSLIKDEDDLAVSSVIYRRIIKALEQERPDLKGEIALCDVPVASNGFLRDDNGDAFKGTFHLLSDPDSKFKFVIDVIDLQEDELKAKITPD